MGPEFKIMNYLFQQLINKLLDFVTRRVEVLKILQRLLGETELAVPARLVRTRDNNASLKKAYYCHLEKLSQFKKIDL
jgi:hypothetical protein